MAKLSPSVDSDLKEGRNKIKLMMYMEAKGRERA
jgi:hypothetical protein